MRVHEASVVLSKAYGLKEDVLDINTIKLGGMFLLTQDDNGAYIEDIEGTDKLIEVLVYNLDERPFNASTGKWYVKTRLDDLSNIKKVKHLFTMHELKERRR